jgi:hypothetical protein
MITREQQVAYCKKCTLRLMDFNQGLLCSLTGQKASFTHECPDFTQDESVKEFDFEPKETFQAIDEALKISPEVMEYLKSDQNVMAGVLSGILAGLAGASMWCAFSVFTGWQISYLAMLIGAGVGFAFALFGKIVEKKIAYLSAFIALLSVVIGNFLVIIGLYASYYDLKFFEVLASFDFRLFPDVMIETFQVLDILFYAVAMALGYKFAFRKITKAKIREIEEMV